MTKKTAGHASRQAGTRADRQADTQHGSRRSGRTSEARACLISVLHKVDAFVHIPKQNERLHNVQAGNQDGRIKESSPEKVTAGPLVGLQAVTNGQNDVTLQACKVSHRSPELPANSL